ncbi:MAG: SH3 domain-containing protein, partial [Clostridia bacterium]|nr:SH3 domain-containing protein [Clostridia bacterium]
MDKMNRFVIKKICVLTFIVLIGIMIFSFNHNYIFGYNQVTLNASSENNNGIELFPDSYQIMLKKLVDDTGHTNWKFRPLYTDIDWNELVTNETNHLHNTIYKSTTSPYPSSWYDSCNKYGDSGYYCASAGITSYYMDCRNFLTETSIFQFLDLSNSSPVSVAQIQEAVRGTFLEGSVNGESYAKMIYDAANQSGEGALSIVVRIFQELGNGRNLPRQITGTDSNYPGVYNFFNWGATDGEGNVDRALQKAKDLGWNSPRTALIEGAKKIANSYTNVGQVNKYLYKFDVVGSSFEDLYTHQYMTNVQDPNSQASTLYSAYDNNNLVDNSLTFIIPVYRNMPAYVKLPSSENIYGNLYYVSSNYSSVAWRTSPSIPSDPSSNRIGYLRKDTIVTMYDKYAGNGFSKISYDGKIGYMSNEYLTPVNTKKDVYFVPGHGKLYFGGEKDPYSLVSYTAQLQNVGWIGWTNDGNTLGTTGENIRLETIKISLYGAIQSEKLQYRAHVQDIGWMNWVSDGEQAGTVNQSKRIEAIQIKLRDLGNYNIKYRVCVEGVTWTNWVQNGETAGTTGQEKKITAIEIKIEEAEPWNDRGIQYKGTQEINKEATVSYNAYLNKAGWLGWRKDGEDAGSSGQRRKLEALKITLNDNIKSEGIQYRAHIQDMGWTNWASDGETVGILDGNKRIEAIQIKLKNGETYDVQYRVHVQDIGWMSWVKNGETAGTEGKLKRIEAIEIKLVEKKPEIKVNVEYKGHVQDVGWMNWVKNGKTAGTTGMSRRVEAIQIKLEGVDSTIKNAISYKVHVQDIGWMDWVSDGKEAGTTGQSKRVEAIQIKLNECLGKTVKYRVHVQDIGWMNWVKNGETAGTTGQSKRIEAIE